MDCMRLLGRGRADLQGKALTARISRGLWSTRGFVHELGQVLDYHSSYPSPKTLPLRGQWGQGFGKLLGDPLEDVCKCFSVARMQTGKEKKTNSEMLACRSIL